MASSEDVNTILQNQSRIMHSLNQVMSKLDSMSDRLSQVEKKIAVMDAAPPPYSSSESRGASALNENKILSELEQVHDTVVLSGFYSQHPFYQKLLIYGIPETKGESTLDVIRKFLYETLGFSEEQIKAYLAFACRVSKSLADGAGRPAPILVTCPHGTSRGKIMSKNPQHLREMNIIMRPFGP